MDRDETLEALRAFIAEDLLEGDDEGLDASTPLLEYGLVNSFSLTRLVAYVHEELGVALDPSELTSEHLRTLGHLADLVVRAARR